MPKKRRSDITTDRLEGMLNSASGTGEQEDIIREYATGGYESFAEYFNEYAADHNLDMSDIIARSNVSRNYIYNIVNGSRNPGRDKILAMCIGAGMNVKEINRALKIAKHGVLYPKDERDARIIIAVNRGVSTVIDINIILEGENLEIIE